MNLDMSKVLRTKRYMEEARDSVKKDVHNYRRTIGRVMHWLSFLNGTELSALEQQLKISKETYYVNERGCDNKVHGTMFNWEYMRIISINYLGVTYGEARDVLLFDRHNYTERTWRPKGKQYNVMLVKPREI